MKKETSKRKSEPTLSTSDQKRRAAHSEILEQLETVETKQDRVNDALDKLQSFIEREPNILTNQKNKTKSINLHTNLLKASELQGQYLRELLENIEKLRKSENRRTRSRLNFKRGANLELITRQGAAMPLWVNEPDGFPIEGVGAIPFDDNSKLVNGDMIAAYSTDENWILAEVATMHSTSRYEIRDVDEDKKEKGGKPARTTVARYRMIPLPKWRADPKYDKHALFPPEAIVLALYPQTTCFYKGVVIRQPAHATDTYDIAFEDSSYPTGYCPPMPVHQKYVVVHRNVVLKQKKDD